MTQMWEHHWTHLHLEHIEMPGRSVLSRVRANPVFQVVPIVEWYYRNQVGQWSPVNGSGRVFSNILTHPKLPILLGWSGHESLSSTNKIEYHFEKDPRTRSLYPLPTSSGEFLRPISAPYLFCRTSRGYLRSGGTSSFAYLGPQGGSNVILADKNDNRIGHLDFSLIWSVSPPADTEFELVVISAGSIIIRDTSLVDGDSELPVGINWGGFQGKPVMTYEWKYRRIVVELYYVLWIGWENGIAHRKGLGRVLKKAWDREKTDEIDLVLG